MGLRSIFFGFAAVASLTTACGSSTSVNGGGAGNGASGAGNGAGQASGGAGGHESGGGGRSAGGSAGLPGSGGSACGPCPGIACFEGIQIDVSPDVDAGAAIISDLTVVSDGTSLECMANGATPCSWFCRSSSSIPNGDHTVTISAPGFQSVTLDFQATAPTNCGCCGCCGFSYQHSVKLEPTGAPVSGCCANLQSDPNDCGACGKACVAGAPCTKGKCGSALTACLVDGGSFTNCDSYCASIGAQCSATCTPAGNVGATQWVGNSGCSGMYTTLGCSDPFQTTSSAAGAHAYACCCG